MFIYVSLSTTIRQKLLKALRTISLFPGLILCSVRKRLRSMFSFVRFIDSNLLSLSKYFTPLIVRTVLYEKVIELRLKGQALSPTAYF